MVTNNNNNTIRCAIGLTSEVVDRCCELGRVWASQSHNVCGPYPGDVTDHQQTAVTDVNDAVSCIAAVDACCVLERRVAQCRVGRQMALTQSACHALHGYHANEHAKVTYIHYQSISSDLVVSYRGY